MVLRLMLGCLLLVTLVIYVVAGVSMSAVPQISRFAAPAVLVGLFALCALGWNDVHRVWIFATPFAFLALSWTWADGAPVGILGNYFTTIAGTALLFGSIRVGVLSVGQVTTLLLLPALINFYAYLSGYNYTYLLNDVTEFAAETRFSGFIGHPSPFVTRLLAPVFLLVVLAPYYKNKAVRLLLLGLATCALTFGIVSSGSKKLLLIAAPLLALMIIGAVRGLARRQRVALVLALFGSVLVTVIAMFGLPAEASLIFDVEVAKRLEAAFSGSDESTLARMSLVGMAPKLFEGAPYFGHGLDQFAVVSGAGYYSHNNAIELLVNSGIFGFALYYGALIWALYCLWKRDGARSVVLAAVPTLVALDMTGITYSDRGSLVFIFALLYRAMYGLGNERSSKNRTFN